MTTEELSSINNDPDYQDFHESNKNDPNYVRAADSKDLAISKIKTILEKQFAMELEFKEQEILKVEHCINTTKSCLLYTSPSPRDLSTSRMPSSA